MIGWEDRDDAGRVAVLCHFATGQVKVARPACTEWVVGIAAAASVAYHWTPLIHQVLNWF